MFSIPAPQNLRIALCSVSLLVRFTVIGGPSSEQLARRIATKLKSKYVGCDLRVFPDGEGKITLRSRPAGKIIVVQSVYPPVDSNLVRVLALVSQARKYSAQVYAVIPYMGSLGKTESFCQARSLPCPL